MKKYYNNQLFTMEDGKEFLIDVVVKDECITNIYAGEDINYKDYHFKKGELINCDGNDSMIRSEDILIGFLQED